MNHILNKNLIIWNQETWLIAEKYGCVFYDHPRKLECERKPLNPIKFHNYSITEVYIWNPENFKK